MSKSGQPATKADTGGQRISKNRSGDSGKGNKTSKADTPAKSGPGKNRPVEGADAGANQERRHE